ncbi:MAG TPA: hypothetical protein VFB21_22260 [Chthonomonadaceae bacterium]|nr:hypothetical protein [Chthonomonadaceae bacterium]
MRTEQDVLERLREDGITLPPLSFQLIERQPEGKPGLRLDAIVRACWQNRSYDFGLEYKSLSTPKAFQGAIYQTLEGNRLTGTYPMIMMPYLSDAQLRELEARQISGLDLCGNGIVTVPGELLVFRTGAPNKFPNSAPIKNVYRRASSIVARVFLLHPTYPTVNDILQEIARRDGHVSVATVSKVLKTLEEDVIVGREKGKIRLLHPEKLLNRLVENYQPPKITRFFEGKTSLDVDTLIKRLIGKAARFQLPLVGTGVGSTNVYGVMARGEILSIYCPQLYKLLAGIPAEETTRFPNIEVIETHDETVYFDARYQQGFPWASPIQTYLELMAGDERDKQTAEQVKEIIFREMEAQTA